MFPPKVSLEVGTGRRCLIANIAKIFSAVHLNFVREPIVAIVKEMIRFETVFKSANIGSEVAEEMLPGESLDSR